jgi:hypothetical protein
LILLFLTLSAFAAGFVDSIAGGGGLITLPALLACGVDPRAALATNKGQAVFGSCTSLVTFAHSGNVDRSRAALSFAFACLGSIVGALLVLVLSPKQLRPLVVTLLVIAAASAFLKKPNVDSSPLEAVRKHPSIVASAIAFSLGCYDGFFGPGTGTFLILAYAYLFGDTLIRASGNAKVANFASNLAAFCLFALSGSIQWRYAVPMGIAQAVGAVVGTRLAIRKGARLIRSLAVMISLGLAARVVWQMFTNR